MIPQVFQDQRQVTSGRARKGFPPLVTRPLLFSFGKFGNWPLPNWNLNSHPLMKPSRAHGVGVILLGARRNPLMFGAP